MNKNQYILIPIIVFSIVKVISLDAQQADALLLYRQGEYSKAVQVCLSELEQTGSNQLIQRMDSYTVLGWSLIRLGEYTQVLSYVQQAKSELANDIRIIEIEAEALFYLGRITESLSLFEQYVALDFRGTGSRIDVVHYFMGEIYLQLSELNHADMAFSTAVYYNPQIAQWWTRLGYVREQIPDIQGAIDAYSQALKILPAYEDALAGLKRVNQS